jgi:hypothetical protein
MERRASPPVGACVSDLHCGRMKEERTLSLSEITRHWLLNTTVEFGVPLAYLFPEVSQALNVRPVPDCGSEDYASGLMELFGLGMITFSSVVEGDDTDTLAGVRKILERFRALSKDAPALRCDGRLLKLYELRRLPGMQVYFELTPLGGEAWEKSAQPHWTRYLSASTVFPVIGVMAGECELISADRDLMMAYMGWYSELSGEQIQLETVTWQTHTDFKIVYWKQIPFVHHASFQVHSSDRRWIGEVPRWFQDWWTSSQSWYTKPWDLHGWPFKK